MKEYHIQKPNQRLGPVSEEVLKGMIARGEVAPSDLIWTEGYSNWLPLSSTDLGAGVPPTSPSATPPNLGPAPITAPAQANITNYLPWAIAATILCCLPGGIASIIYACRANSEKSAGNIKEAQEAASKAKIWLFISIGVGVVCTTLWFVAGFIGTLANH